jgi:cell cycle sensor histidine kinase DivJ
MTDCDYRTVSTGVLAEFSRGAGGGSRAGASTATIDNQTLEPCDSLVTAPDRPETGPTVPPLDGELALALIQSLGWSAVTLTALGVLVWLSPELSSKSVAALLVGAAPGLIAQLLRWRSGERARLLVIGTWALCGALAAGLTGGLAGPLAAWCAMPFAAALAFDRRKFVSGGAALALVAFALALWASLTGRGELPQPSVALWLGALSVGTTTAWLAASVTRSLRSRTERASSAEGTAGRLEALLAEQPHLLMTVDPAGRLSSAFGAPPPGFSLDLLLEQGLIGAAHHPDRPALQTALFRAATHGEAECGFTPRAALDRHASIALRRLDDGRLIGVLRDASVQHAREAALEAAKTEADQLNAGKSRFLANMSHELRTPLNAVIGFSDIMRQRLFGPIPEKYGEYAQLIHESGGHLLDLINDVLDMSKIEAARYDLHKEVFDAREPVSAALRLVRLQAHEADVALRGVLPGEPVLVEADQRAVKQIALNLLSNAMKFTPAGGSVTVSVDAREDVLEIVVADTGVGIAPDDLKRLGRPFEQAGDAISKSRGAGLGLSLVRAFAQLHGGEMNIESTLGEGTAVTVRLPVVVREENGPRQGAEIIAFDSRRSTP